MSEQNRLNFIMERDGIDAMMFFAKQSYAIYRRCLMQSRKRGWEKPHHATQRAYRRSFIESCVVFRSLIHAGM